jgi:hypothetical protein
MIMLDSRIRNTKIELIKERKFFDFESEIVVRREIK